MVDFFAAGIVVWLLTHVTDSIKAMWNLAVALAFTVPDTTALPQVQTIATNSLTVVNVCYVLAVVAAGVMVMTQHTVQSRYGLNELLPRLVVGFVAANFALPICRGLIEFGNAFTQALIGPLDTSGAYKQLLRVLYGALGNQQESFLVLFLALMVAVLTGMLLTTMIVRLGVLIVLVGTSPLALACHGTPFTEPVAKLWWRSFGGLLATVTVQGFALHTTVVIFLDPNANLAFLGIPNDPTGIFNLFVIACLLWATIKVPSLMRRYITKGGGGGRNPVGVFLRMMVIQQLTGMLRIPVRGAGKAVGRGAGAAAGRAGAGSAAPNAANTAIPYWRPRMPRPTPARPAATPATSGGGTGSPARPLVPPGVNPATAMPKTRPAWQGGTPATSGQGAGSGSGRPRVAPGTTPATAMPKTRPAWQGGTPTAAPTAGSGRPRVAPGTTPATAMPKVRPAWQSPPRPRPGAGGPSPRRRL